MAYDQLDMQALDPGTTFHSVSNTGAVYFSTDFPSLHLFSTTILESNESSSPTERAPPQEIPSIQNSMYTCCKICHLFLSSVVFVILV